MSTDGFNPPDDRSRSDGRSAFISLGTVILGLLAYWFLFGRDAQESVKIAEQTRVAQLAVEEKIEGNEQVVSQLQSQLQSVRNSFQKNETDLAEAQAMRGRLAKIEEALSGLPQLVQQAKSEIDANVMRTARSRGEFVASKKLVDDVASELERLAKLTHGWQTEFEPLLEDDRGRRLAGDLGAVRQFVTAVSPSLPTTRESVAWTAEFNEVSRPVREAAKAGAVEMQTTAEDQTYFEGMLTRVKTACDALARRQETVELLLAQSSQLPVSATTLKRAIEKCEQDELRGLLAEAEERRFKALKAAIAQQSLEVEQAEQARIAAETKLRVAEKKAEEAGLLSATQEVEQQLEEVASQAARKKLEADFARDEVEIHSLLAPFISDSNTQPSVGNPDEPLTWISHGGGTMAVSFGRLQGSGSLEDTQLGRHRLYFFGGSSSAFRPTRGFPQYVRTGLNDPGIVTRIDRARELLLKYGPLMVEKGMLSK